MLNNVGEIEKLRCKVNVVHVYRREWVYPDAWLVITSSVNKTPKKFDASLSIHVAWPTLVQIVVVMGMFFHHSEDCPAGIACLSCT